MCREAQKLFQIIFMIIYWAFISPRWEVRIVFITLVVSTTSIFFTTHHLHCVRNFLRNKSCYQLHLKWQKSVQQEITRNQNIAITTKHFETVINIFWNHKHLIKVIGTVSIVQSRWCHSVLHHLFLLLNNSVKIAAEKFYDMIQMY